MSAGDELRRLKELHLPPTDEFVVIDIPEMQFLMIEGDGTTVNRYDPSGRGRR